MRLRLLWVMVRPLWPAIVSMLRLFGSVVMAALEVRGWKRRRK